MKFERSRQMEFFNRNHYHRHVQSVGKAATSVKEGVLYAHHGMERAVDKVMTSVTNGIILGSAKVKGEIPVAFEAVKETAVKVKCAIHPHPVEENPDDSRTELVTIEIS